MSQPETSRKDALVSSLQNNNNSNDNSHRESAPAKLGRVSPQVKSQLRKRLNRKQRQSFDWIVNHGYHPGLDNLSQEPTKKSRKRKELELQLSHRPTPNNFTQNNNNDTHIPNDLKKADLFYLQSYGYREMTTPQPEDKNRHPTLSTCNSDSALKAKRRKNENNNQHPNLEWKFGQRSKLNEMNARGIVTNEYMNVILGDKDINKANEETQETRQSMAKKIKPKIG